METVYCPFSPNVSEFCRNVGASPKGYNMLRFRITALYGTYKVTIEKNGQKVEKEVLLSADRSPLISLYI